MTEKANKLKEKLEEKKQKPLTSKVLSKELGSGLKEKLEGERSIIIKMKAGNKPVVEFGGFWNGKFIRAAQNALAKAYRTRRHQFIGRT